MSHHVHWPAGRRRGKATALAAAIALIAALSLAVPSLAAQQQIGYTAGDLPGSANSYCAAGQACTYVSSGSAQWLVPADGTIASFTVSHGSFTGSQQVALLLVRYDDSGTGSWTVDQETSLFSLQNTSAASESFNVATPLQAKQGEALAVSVIPDAGDTAANVLVNTGAGGESLGSCPAAGAPSSGQTFSGGCQGTPAESGYVVGVSAALTTPDQTTTSTQSTTSPSGQTTTTPQSSQTTTTNGSSQTTTTGPTIPWYQSHPISAYKAAEIAFYKATIIQSLPPAPPIAQLPASNWSLNVPATCEAACVLVGTAEANLLGVLMLDPSAEADIAASRTVTLGTLHVTGKGRLRGHLRIKPQFRRALLKAHRTIRLTIREKVVDKRYHFTKTRRQTLVLRP